MNGWKCPECGAVYAPSVTKCDGCSRHPAANAPNFPPRLDIDPECKVSKFDMSTGGGDNAIKKTPFGYIECRRAP